MRPHSVGHHRHPSPPGTRDILDIPGVPDVIEQHVAFVHAKGLVPPRNEGLRQRDVYFPCL